MDETFVAVVAALVLSFSVGAGAMLGKRGPEGGRRRVPVATMSAVLLVGIPSILQLTIAPTLLGILERDRDAILTGEIWRLATSLVVQDGGVAGTVFNLVALAVVGAIAELVWGASRWAIIALGSGVVAQLWGLVVQPIGAGNSVAVFGLAASVSVAGLLLGRGPARILGSASLLGAAWLLVTNDIHGGAAAIGAATAVAAIWTDRHKGPHRVRAAPDEPDL